MVGEKYSGKFSEAFVVLCKKLLNIFLSVYLTVQNSFQLALRRRKLEVVSHDY